LETTIVEFDELGLSLNLFSHLSEERKIDILKKFESLSPDIRKTSAKNLSLLSSPLFEDECLIFSQQFWENSTC
jgi:hypothetical protein